MAQSCLAGSGREVVFWGPELSREHQEKLMEMEFDPRGDGGVEVGEVAWTSAGRKKQVCTPASVFKLWLDTFQSGPQHPLQSGTVRYGCLLYQNQPRLGEG